MFWEKLKYKLKGITTKRETQVVAETKSDHHDRPLYANYAEFILSCIGYSVGLGNIWRFPQLAYENGGGAFLIPYWISVILAGLPFYFLELALGQYSSLGVNCVYKNLAPISQGVGWAMVVCSLLVALYYNLICSWVLFYFFYSFRAELPWSNCRHDWNTASRRITHWDCYSNLEENRCREILNDHGAKFYNKTCWGNESVSLMGINDTLSSIRKVAPSEEFFNIFMLGASDSFENVGSIQWPMVVALGVAWLMVFVCLSKGIQTTGKAVYVTATFPYVVLFILLIRGATLEGARNGILFYVTPDFKKITSVEPWIKAATQVFYSLGPAFGGIITMASYMPFKNNVQRDAIIVSLVDSFTSMLAGCTIFSIMGFMAHDLGTDIQNVTKSGPGLAFIAFPEAMVRMPVAPLWSVLFFFMMMLLGLDSEFATLETCTTAILDQFPILRPHKTWVIFSTCAACFLFGLIFCTNGGIYYFTLFDDYSAGYCLLVICLFECIIVCYVYGIKNFSNDICAMLGWKPNYYWLFMWCIGSPIYMFIVLIFTFVGYAPSSYGDYTFTYSASALGWLVSALSIMWIPFFALFQVGKLLYKEKSLKNWRYLFRHSEKWCPVSERRKLTEIQMNSRNNQSTTSC